MAWCETKRLIFDEAVRLFSEKGYNVVSVREIAAAAGIVNASAIYAHFGSKEDILNEIMSTFEERLKRYLLTKEQVDVYIKTDTPRRLLERCLQNFRLGENEFMANAYRIVCMEQMTNPKAKALIVELVHGETANSIRYALDRLVERDKIPALDTRLFSGLWTKFMFSEAVLWLSGFHDGQAERISSPTFFELGEFIIDTAISGKLPFGGS